jgi:RNA polymerase sigma-70 factor, ECF subfamily
MAGARKFVLAERTPGRLRSQTEMMRQAALADSALDADGGPGCLGGPRAPAAVSVARPARDLESRIFSLVYRQMHALYGRWQSDYDDLAQAAAEQALRALPSFRREADLSTWTYQICYRAVLHHRRWYRRWLRRFTLDAPGTLPEAIESENAESRLEQRERLARLASALDALSEKRRAVIVLRDIEGLGIPAIAEIVGASEATVRSRLRDGRRMLAESLRADPYFGAEAGEEKCP